MVRLEVGLTHISYKESAVYARKSISQSRIFVPWNLAWGELGTIPTRVPTCGQFGSGGIGVCWCCRGTGNSSTGSVVSVNGRCWASRTSWATSNQRGEGSESKENLHRDKNVFENQSSVVSKESVERIRPA